MYIIKNNKYMSKAVKSAIRQYCKHVGITPNFDRDVKYSKKAVLTAIEINDEPEDIDYIFYIGNSGFTPDPTIAPESLVDSGYHPSKEDYDAIYNASIYGTFRNEAKSFKKLDAEVQHLQDDVGYGYHVILVDIGATKAQCIDYYEKQVPEEDTLYYEEIKDSEWAPAIGYTLVKTRELIKFCIESEDSIWNYVRENIIKCPHCGHPTSFIEYSDYVEYKRRDDDTPKQMLCDCCDSILTEADSFNFRKTLEYSDMLSQTVEKPDVLAEEKLLILDVTIKQAMKKAKELTIQYEQVKNHSFIAKRSTK